MEKDIQNILRGISAIYKQLEEIKAKLDQQPAVIVTPEAKPKYNGNGKYGNYPPKLISEPQLDLLKNLLSRSKTMNEEDILIKYYVAQLNELTTKQAGEVITTLKAK